MKDSKIIVVTGASSGFGLEIAAYLSDLGHTVYGTARSAVKKDLNFDFYHLMLPLKNQ